MNWGNKLMIVFIAFAALIGTLVYKAVNTKFELVTPEYYKDELHYQDQINGSRNAAEISDVMFQQTDEKITIVFPKELNNKTISGEAWFYKKTDAQKDRRLKLETTTGDKSF